MMLSSEWTCFFGSDLMILQIFWKLEATKKVQRGGKNLQEYDYIEYLNKE